MWDSLERSQVLMLNHAALNRCGLRKIGQDLRGWLCENYSSKHVFGSGKVAAF